MKKTISLGATLVVAFSSLLGQRMELGLFGGASLYSGDLTREELGVYVETLKPAFGLFTRLNAGDFVAFRLGLNYGTLSADDTQTGIASRMLQFKTELIEFGLTGEVHLFRLGSRGPVMVRPYLFAGGALFHFNPKAKLEDNYVELQPLGTEGQGLPGYKPPYKLSQFSIPAGMGLKFTFSDYWTLGLEFGARRVYSDYIDDVSGTLVDYDELLAGNGPLSARLSRPNPDAPGLNGATYQRGGDADDWYFLGGLTISYYLDGGNGGGRGGRGKQVLGCPTF